MIEFKLDIKSGVPFYRQIVDQIRYGIASGHLLPGEQLPTVRDLAVRLEINPNTIRKAYSELEILGILDTQQGTGTFISHKEIEITDLNNIYLLYDQVDYTEISGFWIDAGTIENLLFAAEVVQGRILYHQAKKK